MTITLRCPSCSKRFNVKEELGGRKIRCAACQAVFAIPVASQSTTDTAVSRHDTAVELGGSAQGSAKRRTSVKADKPTTQPGNRRKSTRRKAESIPLTSAGFQKWLAAAFREDVIEPVEVRWSYRLAVILVAVLMVALPFVYIGLIGAIAVGTWLAAGYLLTEAGPFPGGLLVALTVLCGIAMILFMLKPFFSKPGSTGGRRTLKRDDEPFLFEFVEKICDIVKSPCPSQIDIDCSINAGAGFNRGMLSMFGGDLRLTIGMSVVAGLTVQQFAGVLAHEFGHFSQGAGMRVSYFIRSLNYWLTRVVYERDTWDLRLHQMSENSGGIVALLVRLPMLGIWLARRVLWVFMLAGHAVSGFLLRQMEFDADRHETRVSGWKSFEETSRRMGVLHIAHHGAISDLQQFHDEGRLADDLPRLIVLNVEEIPGKILKEQRKSEEEATTGVFDSHPCHRDRVANAKEDGSSGIITSKNPAEQLFRRFAIRSRGVTLDYYTEVFGTGFKKKLIRPLSELIELRKIHEASLRALRRYFQGNFSWYRCVSMPTETWKPLDMQKKSTLLQNRQEVLNTATKYEKAWKKYGKAEGQLIEAKLARTLIDAGYTIQASSFSLSLTTRGQIRQAIDKLGVRQGKAEPILTEFESAAADRMSVTLRIARSSDVAPQLAKRGFGSAELDELIQIYSMICESIHQLVEIHDHQMILGKLIELIAEGHRHDAVLACTSEQMDFLGNSIASLHKQFLLTVYPFDHARAGMTLAEYMLKSKRLPAFSDPVELYNAADNVSKSLPYVQARVLGRLCEFSEAVETIAGMTPMEDLQPDEDDDD